MRQSLIFFHSTLASSIQAIYKIYLFFQNLCLAVDCADHLSCKLI